MTNTSWRITGLAVAVAIIGLGAPITWGASAKARAMSVHDGGVNVSVNFTMHMPLTDTSDQVVSDTQKRGRTFIYRMASEECAVLMKTIASTCRLTNLNVSAQVRDHSHNRPVTLYLNGSARYMITLKGF